MTTLIYWMKKRVARISSCPFFLLIFKWVYVGWESKVKDSHVPKNITNAISIDVLLYSSDILIKGGTRHPSALVLIFFLNPSNNSMTNQIM